MNGGERCLGAQPPVRGGQTASQKGPVLWSRWARGEGQGSGLLPCPCPSRFHLLLCPPWIHLHLSAWNTRQRLLQVEQAKRSFLLRPPFLPRGWCLGCAQDTLCSANTSCRWVTPLWEQEAREGLKPGVSAHLRSHTWRAAWRERSEEAAHASGTLPHAVGTARLSRAVPPPGFLG